MNTFLAYSKDLCCAPVLMHTMQRANRPAMLKVSVCHKL